ncbi:class I SAM-dependent methyltransferase [Granulosicoccus antarcticus]|uniref:Methyltransferase domain-containing protein n=1 Tax=Granulosicoccus antarcticus IMCC3135 TaxID=1192854 RepID=A0A2Z2NJ56_9GAMM|nr:class I SAM-dependent methyltransferase [Granulosicoccus antarcticus]ASJ71199.1 hypothetical protein IMCC3135_05435 [Granulosicoccus antarcticus IMCC3135]
MVNDEPSQAPSGFSQQWLSLREPADHTARDSVLSESLQGWAKLQTPLHIMDFGTGTGSNLRYLCPLLGHDQHWTLVDNDAQLLTQLPDILSLWATSNDITVQHANDALVLSNETFSASVHWQQSDLANYLAELPFETTDLVTGSALLDLTSRRWLDQLARLCISHRCASFFVLNYNGHIDWQPVTETDSLMRQLLNAHQLSDKGFGPALGPQAGQYLASLLEARQAVTLTASDWGLSPTHRELQAALIEGWAAAAIEQHSGERAVIDQWQTARNSFNSTSMSQLTVGHVDLLALP